MAKERGKLKKLENSDGIDVFFETIALETHFLSCAETPIRHVQIGETRFLGKATISTRPISVPNIFHLRLLERFSLASPS
jgi:hypothetical protein